MAMLALAAAGCGGDDAVPRRAATTPALDGRIVFSQQVGEHRDLFLIRPDGLGLRRLTRAVTEAGNPDWSPDGRTIVYDDAPSIKLIDTDVGNVRLVGPRGEQEQPAFSPDGRWIAFDRDLPHHDSGIWLMRADGSDLHRLTRNPYAGGGPCGCDVDPNFSPDGRTISFLRRKDEERGLGALFTMDPKGRHLRRITPWRVNPGTKHDWKPDGSLIAFSRDADPYPGESSNVMAVRPDGSGLRALTHHRGGRENSWVGSWSYDGRHLVYKNDATGAYQLYVMDADGGDAHRISREFDDPRTADWGATAPPDVSSPARP